MTRLILVRHGQTDYNAERRIQGHVESKLSALGVEQSESLGSYLSNEKVDAVYSSDLGRAMQTAKIIASYHNLDVTPLKELRERSYGYLEGEIIPEIEKSYPELWLSLFEMDFRPRDGESLRDALDRSLPSMRAIIDNHREQTVVVVAHGIVNEVLLNALTGDTDFERITLNQKNSCFNILEINNGTTIVHSTNNLSHLK